MALVDTGLLGRYYFDEAASGTAPTQIDDFSGNAYHLTPDYGSGNMAYTEVSGNRGLESTSVTGTQRAAHRLNDSSDTVRDGIDGSTTATLEMVFDPDSFTGSGSRIWGLNGGSGENGSFILKATSTTSYTVAINNTDSPGFNPSISARAVVHVVFDSTEGTQDDRVRVYVNGSLNQSLGADMSIGSSATITLGSSMDLIALNRANSTSYDRSMDGRFFYSAIYSSALTSGNVSTNYTILSSDDDEPVAGGSSIPAIVNSYRQRMS